MNDAIKWKGINIKDKNSFRTNWLRMKVFVTQQAMNGASVTFFWSEIAKNDIIEWDYLVD